MPNSLPSHPSLENLKKQAKTLQRKCRLGNPEALARLRAKHPQYAKLSNPRLSDCQLVLAREAGFESWPQLKVAVESARKELAQRFVEIACLCYDDPHYDHRSFHQRAGQMLIENPELADASIWSASAAGNAKAIESFFSREPATVNAAGPNGWTALFCACYARVPGRSTFEAAKLLLDRGADPNTHTWKHNDPPGSDRARRFTALTGLFGGGSTGLANQPPHPQWRELAELLLERGADPSDEQALWINPDASLGLLLRHGLRANARVGTITLLGRELSRAATRGNIDQVKLLLAHGARTDEQFQAKTPWQHAMERGNLEIARLLEEAGAPSAGLDDVDRFTSFVLAGAREKLAPTADLLERASKSMVLKAVDTGRIEAVRLALDLEFDPNYLDEVTASHSAAGKGRKDMVELLLDRGASLCIREPFYDGTPLGWADFFDQVKMREWLLNEGPICLFDALDMDRLDRVPDILARDPEALSRPFAKCLTREPKLEDWQTPLARMRARGKTEAVRVLLEHGAREEA